MTKNQFIKQKFEGLYFP